MIKLLIKRNKKSWRIRWWMDKWSCIVCECGRSLE